MLFFFKRLGAVGGLFLLASCTSFTPEKRRTYLAEPEVRVCTRSIQVSEDAGFHADADGFLPVSIFQMIKQWADSALKPVGHTDILHLDVQEARLKDTRISNENNGMLGWVTNKPKEMYTCTIRVKVYTTTSGMGEKSAGIVSVEAQRALSPGFTVKEKRLALTEFVEDVIEMLRHAVEKHLTEKGQIRR